MEMEKSYYVVTYKQAYLELLRQSHSPGGEATGAMQGTFVSITQGGFGLDIVDDERQVKERFLEYLFFSTGVDLPRTPETFDQYFALEKTDLVDLDEES